MELITKSFYFIRHGQTDWNKEGRLQGQINIPLNTIGREQALTLQPLITKLEISCVYYSTLSRAEETMQIACEHLQVPKIGLPALQERHFGEWQGMIWDEFMVDNHNHYDPVGSETCALYYERVITGANMTLSNAQDKILFVSHGGTFWELYKATKLKYDKTHTSDFLKNCLLLHFIAPNETETEWQIHEIET